jgi:Cofactor assembly of complex C subunit B, CCB2/CCB4
MMTEKNGDDTPKSPKVKFTSLSTSIPTNASPVDVVLTWLTSDIGSIVLGGVGLLLLLVGRLILDGDAGNTAPEAMAEQARVNLLAVFAIGAVLLNGLSELDVQSALAEKVDLMGKVVSQPVIINQQYDNISEQISWVLSSILAATPAGTVILLVRSEDEKVARWKPIAYVGVLPANMMIENVQLSNDTPIMDRMLRVATTDSERRESYLPTLQALPGRIEFTNYLLPSNTQAALLLPLRLASAHTATLLLGSNQARSFTPRDIAWSQAVATRLELPLE